jgi:hypothetical protein
MNAFWPNVFDLISRYLHLVCAAVLVGGTLFYEMVVPVALEELKPEQQLAIFARARWKFKWIVLVSVAVLAITGVVSSWANWQQYAVEYTFSPGMAVPVAVSPALSKQIEEIPPWGRSGWWWAAHASCGALAILIALSLMIGSVPPSQPIRWMRLNLVILLVVFFLATATRHARIANDQPPGNQGQPPVETHGP